MERYQDIERSIIKKFRKDIWSKFTKAVRDFELVQEGDKVMVCISGGKDSFLLAKCIEELSKHSNIKFETKYVVMNPGYTEKNLEKIKENAKILNLPIEIFDTDIFDVSNLLNEEKPCYMCARMRRGHLYNKAKELGCNKIALGHHKDDVIETTLLSMMYAGEIKTMLPKLHSSNFEGIDLIRPLYYVREKDVLEWVKYNNLEFINCACKFTMNNEYTNNSKRKEIKDLVKRLEDFNPEIIQNIFNSTSNVDIRGIIGYRDKDKYHSFLDDFNK